MNIQTDKPFMVFRKDGKYGPMYSISISKKNQNNGYDVAYIPVQFKKGVELENKTKIYMKNCWLSFYITNDKNTKFYIFIDKFETIEDTIERVKEEVKEESQDPFQEFANETGGLELPF